MNQSQSINRLIRLSTTTMGQIKSSQNQNSFQKPKLITFEMFLSCFLIQNFHQRHGLEKLWRTYSERNSPSSQRQPPLRRPRRYERTSPPRWCRSTPGTGAETLHAKYPCSLKNQKKISEKIRKKIKKKIGNFFFQKKGPRTSGKFTSKICLPKMQEIPLRRRTALVH